jgi:predicted RNase H-like HicB family nuclease
MQCVNNWVHAKESVFGLEQEVANQQKTPEEALTRAIEAKKECLNSMENIEHYNQTLIDERTILKK